MEWRGLGCPYIVVLCLIKHYVWTKCENVDQKQLVKNDALVTKIRSQNEEVLKIIIV